MRHPSRRSPAHCSQCQGSAWSCCFELQPGDGDGGLRGGGGGGGVMGVHNTKGSKKRVGN
jgi:hypothetical protein